MQSRKNQTIKKAFTLAEVLITLGIIGVVAAMTIPILMNNIQDNEFRNHFKKVYAVLNQSLQMIQANNESVNFITPQEFMNSFSKYFSFVQTGTAGDLGIVPKCYKNSLSCAIDNSSIASGILKDGVFLEFASWGDGTTTDCGKYSITANGATVDNICATIEIDVNGKKPPNMMGRDFFRVWVRQNGQNIIISPFGFKQEYPCAISSTDVTYGFGCAENAILNLPFP